MAVYEPSQFTYVTVDGGLNKYISSQFISFHQVTCTTSQHEHLAGKNEDNWFVKKITSFADFYQCSASASSKCSATDFIFTERWSGL